MVNKLKKLLKGLDSKRRYKSTLNQHTVAHMLKVQQSFDLPDLDTSFAYNRPNLSNKSCHLLNEVITMKWCHCHLNKNRNSTILLSFLFAVCVFTQIKWEFHIYAGIISYLNSWKSFILRSSPWNIIFQMTSSLLHWVAKPVYPSSSATCGTNSFQFEKDKLWELSAQMINYSFACFPSKDWMICPVK